MKIHMKTKNSNFVILLVVLCFVSCTNKPQQKATVDIFFFKSINSQTEEFQNQIKQILEPFSNFNDSLIIIPEGKLYYVANNSLEYIDLNLRETIYSKSQKSGKFQTLEMVLKQAETSRNELNLNAINVTEAISDSVKINCLNKLLRTNSYHKQIAFIPSTSDSVWNEFIVIHDLKSLKSTIQEKLNMGISNALLIIYNPPFNRNIKSKVTVIDNKGNPNDEIRPQSLPTKESLHEDPLKSTNNKKTRTESIVKGTPKKYVLENNVSLGLQSQVDLKQSSQNKTEEKYFKNEVKQIEDKIVLPAKESNEIESPEFIVPSNYRSIVGWFQAMQIEGTSEPSSVQLEYIKLYAATENGKIFLNPDDFKKFEGDFPNNKYSIIPREYFNSEGLFLKTSTDPYNKWVVTNKLWKRAKIENRANKCWIEVKYKITGPAYINFGIKFYKGDTNESKNAGETNWFKKQGVWQTKTLEIPLGN